MNASIPDDPLKVLETRDLSAVVFVRDYIQLQFDGPTINAYVWPAIITENGATNSSTSGYRDLLCEQIGKRVARAKAEPNKKLIIWFIDGTVLEISLKDSDRTFVEAALIHDGSGFVWEVWR